MHTPDAYRCDFCGATYDAGEFYDKCHSDGLGNLEFRCFCGSHDYTELYKCHNCDELEKPFKNEHLVYDHICNECLEAIVSEYNTALEGISERYRKVLNRIYDIRPINMKED